MIEGQASAEDVRIWVDLVDVAQTRFASVVGRVEPTLDVLQKAQVVKRFDAADGLGTLPFTASVQVAHEGLARLVELSRVVMGHGEAG